MKKSQNAWTKSAFTPRKNAQIYTFLLKIAHINECISVYIYIYVAVCKYIYDY